MVKLAADAPVPPGVVMWIFPVLAQQGTCVVIFVAETTVNEAERPLKSTFVAPVR